MLEQLKQGDVGVHEIQFHFNLLNINNIATDKIMMEKTTDDLNAWKTEMHTYEKGKRTKKPFGKSVPKNEYVTYYDVKQKQTLFNPILQTYKHQNDEERRNQTDDFKRTKSLVNHLKQHKKYEREFDIVNLYSSQPYQAKDEYSPNKLGPVRNVYNVVNNQLMPDFHFKNRQFRLPVERQKNLIKQNEKQFNIVTGIFNQNHEERAEKERKDENQYIFNKYWKTHDYDTVYGKYYSDDKEMNYQEQKKIKQKYHGKDADKHLPPSYIQRQTAMLDPTKPIPEALKTLDERKLNAKKRYEMRYVVQDEYGRRNFEDDKKYETIIKNRVHNNRLLEEKAKQFNIVNNRQYPETRAEDLYSKKIVKSTWEKIQPKIKSEGFKV